MNARVTGRSMALLALALSLWAAPARAQDGRPEILQRTGIDQNLDAQIPLDLPFRDENGQTVQLRQYFGEKPVIVSLVYYECPMLCTIVLNGMVSAMRAMSLGIGEDFEVVTVSFDPKETPALAAAKKQTYLEQYRRPAAATGWHFLTGDEASIQALARSIGFKFEWDERMKQYAHAAGIVVATPQGRISRYFYGVEYPPRDLRLSLVEASQNRIGSLVDAVLLYCFHWDPLTGRYSQLTMNAIRVGGAVTVLAIALGIFLMLRRERAQTGAPLGTLPAKPAGQH